MPNFLKYSKNNNSKSEITICEASSLEIIVIIEHMIYMNIKNHNSPAKNPDNRIVAF
jgi:hypothetical protein